MKTEISTALERSRAFLKANLQKRLKEEQENQQPQQPVMQLKHTE